MAEHVVLLSIPGLREQDLKRMPRLSKLMAAGDRAPLVPSFPAVTWPVQANMLTGALPSEHGVIANGFYWRDTQKVEMWTAWNDKIEVPQIWDRMREQNAELTSAAWFPMLSRGCNADFICMPAPIHNPDGSESLWCYTRPIEMYGPLRDDLGHFPLKHFWGPLANIESTAWIADSAIYAAKEYQPNFFYIYLTHLDYAAQSAGPDSPAAIEALGEMDEVIGRLVDGFAEGYGDKEILWLVASEYTIVPVDHVTYPNRTLRDAGLLVVREEEDGEHIDLDQSQAWCLVDHQFSHIFVRDADAGVIQQVVELFQGSEGIAEVLAGDQRAKYSMDHPRSGEVILISEPNSWQAYYFWQDDEKAPGYARTVDIHQKPGYDPVELHFDRATMSIPLDATLIKGSHGAPAASDEQQGVVLASQQGVLGDRVLEDVDLAGVVLSRFGI